MGKQSSRQFRKYWGRALRAGYFEGGDTSLEGLASLWAEHCRVQGRPAVGVVTGPGGLGSLIVGVSWLDDTMQEAVTSMLGDHLEEVRSEAGGLLSTGLMTLGRARSIARQLVDLGAPKVA